MSARGQRALRAPGGRGVAGGRGGVVVRRPARPGHRPRPGGSAQNYPVWLRHWLRPLLKPTPRPFLELFSNC
jgi:hypothetical protein